MKLGFDSQIMVTFFDINQSFYQNKPQNFLKSVYFSRQVISEDQGHIFTLESLLWQVYFQKINIKIFRFAELFLISGDFYFSRVHFLLFIDYAFLIKNQGAFLRRLRKTLYQPQAQTKSKSRLGTPSPSSFFRTKVTTTLKTNPAITTTLSKSSW